jgi:hypothetical protein
MERFPPETSPIPLGDYASATGVPVKKPVKSKLHSLACAWHLWIILGISYWSVFRARL